MTPRTVVITGVTRGLGLALAEEFIRLGHAVPGCGRTTLALRSGPGAPFRSGWRSEPGTTAGR